VEFELTDDQDLLRDTTRRFLERECPVARVREIAGAPAGFERALWKSTAELGWNGLLVDAVDGGCSVSGDGLVDAAIVAETLGAFVHPAPVISAIVVAMALSASGSAEQHDDVLPALIAGEIVVAWCLAGPEDSWTRSSSALRAEPKGTQLVLRGTRSFVEFASAADFLLAVVDAERGPTQVLVPADAHGVTITPLDSIDLTRRLGVVHFDDVVVPAANLVGEIGRAASAIEDELRVAVVLQCAETVGAVDRVFGQTLEYAKDRVAFGRPIGSYQAIKHRLADMAMWLEACKGTASNAARVARQPGAPGGVAVSVAKAYVAEQARAIVSDCQQITGGIAMTWEHDLHLYLRRVVANAALYGSPVEHRERLCALVDDAA
jgi:alkylation response protein AidB-like acyl-CoA dehydrogenase